MKKDKRLEKFVQIPQEKRNLIYANMTKKEKSKYFKKLNKKANKIRWEKKTNQ